ncbi:hypothetical protein SGQ44_00790 [Flavobacterium sp. Fl-77]|uniref:Uncharacterized protein n=1 Tax=Flavobacterium flavipigmentatum TaxID=2893884 RepID=A0AAJ2VZR7_9FLAO|nr:MULTISPECIES: hypothetical protein [unclassified Flavobacterium]MDX6180670.1 hypothetical protein [Flavobacterium sp. Fl-33]MDX6184270.1 hypothetical protein [Flavobacterium sp. Fl-77]UFH39382.1 hypothetical protein LNP22_03690 [Flavobacterium sp. F-70]
MKIVRTIFLVFFLILINVSNVWAQDPPDPEEPCDTCPPPPLPINDHLLLLGVSAVMLGATVMYKRRKI